MTTVLAERLKELRKIKGVTQKDAAEYLGCTEQHYQRLEYGKALPNSNLLSNLADFFQVSTDYLLGRDDYRHDVKPPSQ